MNAAHIDVIYNFLIKKCSLYLRMCIFFSTSMAPPASGSLLEITVEKCSPYFSSERTCNNELTLFVGVAVVLPLPTKPRALREPYFARNYLQNRLHLLRYLSACTIMNKFPLCSLKLPQIDIIYPFCKYFSFRLRMCFFLYFDGTSHKWVPPRNYS